MGDIAHCTKKIPHPKEAASGRLEGRAVRQLNDGDLPPLFPDEQAFRDHRVHAAHDVDDLDHPEARRDAALCSTTWISTSCIRVSSAARLI
jgi:hypothetical protein